MVLVITFIEARKVLQSEKSRMFQCHIILLNHAPRLTSLRWIESILYYKNGQEECSKSFVSSGSYISASSWLFNDWKENTAHDSS